MEVEYRPVPADATLNDLALDVEVTHAAEAHADAASHLLFHRRLSRKRELVSEPLLDPQEPARSAREERITAALSDEAAKNPLDIRGAACGLGVRHHDDFSVVVAKKINGDDKLRAPR